MARHFKVHNLDLQIPGLCVPLIKPNQRFTMSELINEYLNPVYGLQGTTEKDKLTQLAAIAQTYKTQSLSQAQPKSFILLFDRVDEALCFIKERIGT
jgi:hypothetical protein